MVGPQRRPHPSARPDSSDDDWLCELLRPVGSVPSAAPQVAVGAVARAGSSADRPQQLARPLPQQLARENPGGKSGSTNRAGCNVRTKAATETCDQYQCPCWTRASVENNHRNVCFAHPHPPRSGSCSLDRRHRRPRHTGPSLPSHCFTNSVSLVTSFVGEALAVPKQGGIVRTFVDTVPGAAA